MNLFKKIIANGKDSAISSAIRLIGEKYLSGFASINTFEIDSSKRSIAAEIFLKGEAEPVIITVEGYEIIPKGEKRLFMPIAVSASRPWIDALSKEYIQGHAFEIPAPLAKALTLLP